MDQNSLQIRLNATQIDYNGYYTQKSYHYLILSPDDMASSTKWYLAVAFFSLKYFTASYTIRASSYSSHPCPRQCSKYGQCIAGACSCVPGLLDQDCSVAAVQLIPDSESVSTSLVRPNQWVYYYIEADSVQSDLDLTVHKEGGQMLMVMKLEGFGYTYIPNKLEYDYRYQLPDVLKEHNFGIKPYNNQPAYKGKKLMIGLQNTDDIMITLSIKLSKVVEADDSKLFAMYIVIAVGVVLLVVYILLSFIKYKIQRNEVIVVRMQQGNENRGSLEPGDIDKFFPRKRYDELTKREEQPTCSICLDDFQPDTICRQTICTHIFHDSCIEAWLKNHENCPNCKRELSKTEVENYIKLLQERKDDQPAPAPPTALSPPPAETRIDPQNEESERLQPPEINIPNVVNNIGDQRNASQLIEQSKRM
eukprot:TRINITY_DN1618_c0_g1_i2.p1 TRINITY_DN1618_c0_g1~~TRINITY_DN1618_c0_g1_i2.p1  ORF type:complete len:420 (+),score=21.11 TRINITY_DN1618_c0_g1_i2:565-1824(+)